MLTGAGIGPNEPQLMWTTQKKPKCECVYVGLGVCLVPVCVFCGAWVGARGGVSVVVLSVFSCPTVFKSVF